MREFLKNLCCIGFIVLGVVMSLIVLWLAIAVLWGTHMWEHLIAAMFCWAVIGRSWQGTWDVIRDIQN